MGDPRAVTNALETAEDAFEYRGQGRPVFETGIDQDEEWTTQLTKACRYLDAARALWSLDGYNGAVVELCFSAIERSLEAYVLWSTDDDLGEYHDHVTIYDRVAEVGLFTQQTATALGDLYSVNRTEHSYGGLVPTQQKEDAMFRVADEIHVYVGDQLSEGGVCQCE